MTLALLLMLLAQDPPKADPIEAEIDRLIEKMREGLAARKEATEKLFEIRRQTPRAIRIMRQRANVEKDIRIRVRLEYLAGTRLFLWCWETAIQEAAATIAGAGPEGIVVQRPDRSVSLYAAQNGQMRWTAKEEAVWSRPPILAGGHFYAQLQLQGRPVVRISSLAEGKTRKILVLNPCPDCPVVTSGDFAGEVLVNGRFRCHPADLSGRSWEAALQPLGRIGLGADRLFVYDGGSTLIAFDVATNKKQWQTPTDWGIEYIGATDKVVVTRCTRNRLRCYDASNGNPLWRAEIPKEEAARQPLVLTDKYCISITPKISCRDLATGDEAWSSETGGADRARVDRLHVFGGEGVYAQNGKVYAIRLSSGRVQELDLLDMPPIVRLVGHADMVYLLLQDNRIVAYRFQPGD